MTFYVFANKSRWLWGITAVRPLSIRHHLYTCVATSLYFVEGFHWHLVQSSCASVGLLASCPINAHCTAPSGTPPCRRRQLFDWLHKATTWQIIGRCQVPISLTADAHFAARLGAFFYWTRCFVNDIPFDNTAPIYVINLLWKLGLGFRLESELHYFSSFHGE